MSKWLDWAKQLNAISQAGKTYSKDKYDLERFDQVAHISHQMFAELSDQSVEKVADLFVDEAGYPTPKIDLRAGVIQDGKILLVKEREDGKWTLPGGWEMCVKHRPKASFEKCWRNLAISWIPHA
ncbi:phosphohydrolase [Vibrio ishigakensis]|uniref:Phosphohydrolase n=1 Tax=Vibrio ishigakensis TaxID=1481914 RepID=A0A0B8QV39_9VIBR|nr:phosphohydrolase [Vibrio ishigakensis]